MTSTNSSRQSDGPREGSPGRRRSVPESVRRLEPCPIRAPNVLRRRGSASARTLGPRRREPSRHAAWSAVRRHASSRVDALGTACHAEGRGFESLHPLHRTRWKRRVFLCLLQDTAGHGGAMVSDWLAKPLGSLPAASHRYPPSRALQTRLPRSGDCDTRERGSPNEGAGSRPAGNGGSAPYWVPSRDQDARERSNLARPASTLSGTRGQRALIPADTQVPET